MSPSTSHPLCAPTPLADNPRPLSQYGERLRQIRRPCNSGKQGTLQRYPIAVGRGASMPLCKRSSDVHQLGDTWAGSAAAPSPFGLDTSRTCFQQAFDGEEMLQRAPIGQRLVARPPLD